MIHARAYAFRDRRARKRDFRRLWIARVNAACRMHGLSYSSFINSLKRNDIRLNRKMLSEIAIRHPAAFKTIVDTVKE
jgi:large subunit ribosomal protein L20